MEKESYDDESMTLPMLVNCLKRALNCDKALELLKIISKNGIFDAEMREKYKWDENKVLIHIQEELNRVIDLIEGREEE